MLVPAAALGASYGRRSDRDECAHWGDQRQRAARAARLRRGFILVHRKPVPVEHLLGDIDGVACDCWSVDDAIVASNRLGFRRLCHVCSAALSDRGAGP